MDKHQDLLVMFDVAHGYLVALLVVDCLDLSVSLHGLLASDEAE